MQRSKRGQRGFWNFALPALATVAGSLINKEGQEDTNEQNANINSAQMAFNADQAQITREYNADEAQIARDQQMNFNSAESQKNRDFQANMRSTQYRTAVEDMKSAGLNPMLAYQNGGAGTPSGGQATASGTSASATNASAGSLHRMENTTQAGLNGAMAAAQIANTEAQTKVAEATAEKVKAEVPNVQASTAKMKAELPKITAEIDKLVEEKDNLVKEGWNKTEVGNLLRAQTILAGVETGLKANTINQQDAQIQLTKVETLLKQLGVAGAKNLENWEKFTSDEKLGNASKAAGALANTARAIKSLTGR